jgi:hypothetical protein
VIDSIERFGALIDWAMIILNPLEPWPGELCLDAATANDVKLITRVVDYGGLFFDDLHPGQQLAPATIVGSALMAGSRPGERDLRRCGRSPSAPGCR